MQSSSSIRALELVDNLISFIESNKIPTISKPKANKFTSSTSVTTKNRLRTMAADEKQEELLTNVYKNGNTSLKEVDPAVYAIIKAEEDRQRNGLELIASENFVSMAVQQAVGSVLTNKYSEGLPGKRYYGGNEEIDKLESLCQSRALKVFGLSPNDWAVNVQPYSGSVCNFAAFTALLKPGERFMGLYLPDGGHLSHGFYRGHKSINISSTYFQCLPYYIDPETGYIDYDDLEKSALRFCPKLIVGGSSAYPRDWDYARLKDICDKVGARLLVDMAHFSGLVAAKLLNQPFPYADVVTTTTHKSLRATRSAMIFCRKELEKDINSAVFPGTQGGPHNHAIAGVCVALREASSVEFREYAKQVILNISACAERLMKLGHKIVTNGTDTHLLLWDVRPHGVNGSRVEFICDLAHITINKNTVHGDKSAMNPGGVRVGSPALTSRGFKEDDFREVAELLSEACKIAIEVAGTCEGKKLAEFKEKAPANENVSKLRERVHQFASKFPMPGAFLDV